MKISFLTYDPIADLAELDRHMALVASLGYHGIEMTATHPLGYRVEAVAGLVEKHRLPVASLLSGWSYAHEGLCLSSADAGVRARAVERLVEYVGYAAHLGRVVVVGLMQGLRADEPDESVANGRIADGLHRVGQKAVELGVTVVLEPVNHLQVGFNHTAAAALTMVERVGSPGLGYMLDTIHMNIEERSVVETILAYGGRARHFHLCETNGGPLGGGGLDFPATLDAIRESGYEHFVSVKVYRGTGREEAARQSAGFLKKRGVRFRD